MSHLVIVDPDVFRASLLARALDRSMRVSVISCPAYARAYFDALPRTAIRIVADTQDPDVLSGLMGALHREHPIGGVLGFHDASIGACARACEQQGIRFTPTQAIHTARSKLKTRLAMSGHGLSTPAFAWASQLSEVTAAVAQVGFPCVVKPVHGSGSMFCYPLYQQAHVEWYVKEVACGIEELPVPDQWLFQDGFICERYLKGPVVTVAVAGYGERLDVITTAIGTTQDINPCVGFGNALPFSQPPSVVAACEDYAKRMCKILGLSFGVFDLEMIWGDSAPILLEANPRPMGGEMFSAYDSAYGRHFADIVLDVYTGSRPTITHTALSVTLIRKIMAKAEGRISQDFRSFETGSPQVTIKDYRLTAGAQTRPLEILARLMVTHSDMPAAFVLADQVQHRLQQALGVDLINGELPLPAEPAPPTGVVC